MQRWKYLLIGLGSLLILGGGVLWGWAAPRARPAPQSRPQTVTPFAGGPALLGIAT